MEEPSRVRRTSDENLSWANISVPVRRYFRRKRYIFLRVEPDTFQLADDLADLGRDTVGAFLLPAQRAHQDIAARSVNVGQRHALVAQDQRRSGLRVRGGGRRRASAVVHGFLAVLQVSRKAAEGGGQIADFTRLVTGGGGGAAKKAGV